MINEKENYQIILAGKIHFPAILQLFETVIANSAARGLQTWNKIDECSLQLDIEKGNQYILTGDHGPAGVFTIQPEDRLIWKEMDNQKSLYLHRIAIAPDQKGKNYLMSFFDGLSTSRNSGTCHRFAWIPGRITND